LVRNGVYQLPHDTDRTPGFWGDDDGQSY
jgi:hypothetical protein